MESLVPASPTRWSSWFGFGTRISQDPKPYWLTDRVLATAYGKRQWKEHHSLQDGRAEDDMFPAAILATTVLWCRGGQANLEQFIPVNIPLRKLQRVPARCFRAVALRSAWWWGGALHQLGTHLQQPRRLRHAQTAWYDSA